ncbi:Fanconi anemia group M protein [Larimichthys crocea]|uniref:Uncharacterized protein n=1 Tax=Larimichthys crocea TaxID=215358 RepID=A0ACD3RNW2_LARCR|nr:Fanconi anemia group M protein [Larimichthys crocea]
MLPGGVNPTLHKMHITCGQFDHQENSRRSVRGRRSHSEGRASLIHPQNLIRQGSATSDGFLSSTEYAFWASTMKLQEDEAHPTLKQSHFLSLPNDLPPQKEVSKSGPPPRELSLWEWRHWQHKALPTHVVDHSLRCHHFVKVMELIDGMREENEGECRYEQELLPYLHKADGHVKNGQKKPKSTKTKTTNNKPKPSRITFSDLECIDEEAETKQRLPVPHDTEAPNDNLTDHPGPEAICPRPSNNDCPESDMDEDFVIINEDVIKSEHPMKMLNLRPCSIFLNGIHHLLPPLLNFCLGRDESLKVILANVAELLSRSPPSLTEDLEADMAAKSLPPSPLRPHQPFHVNFTLDVDDDEDEVLMICSGNASPRADSNKPPVDEEDGKIYHDWPHQEQQRSISSRGSVAADSPTWDEVFGQEEENDNHDMRDTNMQTGDEVFKEGWVGKDAESENKTAKKFRFIPAAPMTTSLSTSNSDTHWRTLRKRKWMFLPHVHMISPQPKMPAVSDSSTPYNSFHRLTKPPQSSDPNFSTPQVLSEHRRENRPLFWLHLSCLKVISEFFLSVSPSFLVESISDSEDDVVVPKRRNQNNLLSSPDVSKTSSDVDSPVVVNRKRVAALNTTDEMEGEAAYDDDFQNESVFTRRTAAAERQQVQRGKAKHDVRRKARQFLDEEAELSEEDDGADVSSDEEDGEEEDHSLGGFVVDNTHCSQGLNESEMHGVYLKSVRSPAVQGKFKMSYRNHHNMDIFSQVPEMDETYAEDSFVVGSEVEELESSEEEAADIELIPEDSYVDGKRQYATRRRVFLHKARARVGTKTTDEAPPERRAGVKTKRPRVIRMDDSSEEETEVVSKKGNLNTRGGVADTMWPKVVEQQKPSSASSSSTIASKVSLLSNAQRRSVVEDQQKERCRQRLENQHLLSDELDFTESEMLLSSKKQPQTFPANSTVQDSSVVAPSTAVCILVDSRCISSGVELITSLRQRHAATVHVCSLDGSYFIVSNRMAVERYSQSDLAAMQNRKRLAERNEQLAGIV